MPFDPAFPATDAYLISSEFRSQFTGIVDLIQTIPVGPTGPAGVNSAAVDSVTTGNPGDSASATVGLTGSALHFTFSIPRGDVGAQGTTGNTGADGGVGATGATGPVGPAFTSFVIDSVTSLDPAQPATVTAVFDGTNVKLAFGIPRGLQGPEGTQGTIGSDGIPGAPGAAGAMGPPFTNFVIQSVTTLDPALPATVAATFEGGSVRLDFGIPRGQPGNDGGTGAAGPQGAPGEVSLAQLDTAIANTSSNSNSVAGLAGTYADPDAETLRQKLNELIVALRK